MKDKCPADHILVIATDANCKLGTQPNSLSVGKYNLKKANERGGMLKNFLDSNKLCALNTFFPKKKIQYSTKWCTLHSVWYTCDYIIIEQENKKRAINCSTAPCSITSTHIGLTATFRVRLHLKKLRPKKVPSPRVNWRLLRDPAHLLLFQETVRNSIALDTDQTYTALSNHITAAAENTLTEAPSHNPTWFEDASDSLTPLILARNRSQHKWRSNPSSATHGAFKTARAELKKKGMASQI